MNKVLEIEELTELEVLADLECYALGSYELDNFETKEAQEHYDIIQKEANILKSAIERKDKLEKIFKYLQEELGTHYLLKIMPTVEATQLLKEMFK